MEKLITLFNNYEIIEEVKTDEVFKWVRANDLAGDRKVLLQYITLEILSDQVELLFDFFDKLQSVSKVKLYRPESVLGNKDIPFAAVYEDMEFSALPSDISNEPEKTLVWLKEASEQLFYAHNRDLIHGYISPENFIIHNGKMLLINYGYGPLLEYGNPTAISQVSQYCAPEVTSEQSITPSSDIFSFIKFVAHFLPELKNTYLYKDATSNKPEDRPRRMRDLFEKLEKALAFLQSQAKERKAIEEEKMEEGPGIIRKYRLIVKIAPIEGGRVDGAGNYMISKTVQVRAKPSEGYIFDHWEGDINDIKIDASVTMDCDKNIIAVFIKDPSYMPPVEEAQEPILFKLQLEAIPPLGGKVIGKGNYPEKHIVEIKALPSDGYRFDTWTKDLKSTKNPEIVTITSDKLIRAQFSLGKKVFLTVLVDPPDVGQITFKKDYVSGEKARLRAISSNHNWSFDRWSGDISGSSNPISFTMDKNKNVIAHFEKGFWSGLYLETRCDPSWGGSVWGGNKKYLKGRKVWLEAKANDGWGFSKWDGEHEGKEKKIKITIDKGLTLVAYFVKTSIKREQDSVPEWALNNDKLSPKTSEKEAPKETVPKKSKEGIFSTDKNNRERKEQSPFEGKKQSEIDKNRKPKKGLLDVSILGGAFKNEIDRKKH